MKKTILFSLFILCACELIVDVDVPFDGEQLTVNSFFNTDSLWKASVTLNRHILDRDDVPYKKIDNAIVVIHDETGPIDTLMHTIDGIYQSTENLRPLPGKNYQLRVSAPGYNNVYAESTIPSPAFISTMEIDRTITPQQLEITAKIKFKDNPLETNFYHLFAHTESERYDPYIRTIIRYNHAIPLASHEEDLNPQNIDVDGGIMVNDVFFNGKETTVSAKLFAYDPDSFSKIIIVLRTVSEEYYKYKTTRQLQEETSGDPFAQPVNVFNNIENGFGIFAGCSQSAFIRETPITTITSISPLKGKPGDEILITGENFGTDRPRMRVFFEGETNAISSPIMSDITETSLKVTVPHGAATGRIVVENYGRVIITDHIFEVVQ